MRQLLPSTGSENDTGDLSLARLADLYSVDAGEAVDTGPVGRSRVRANFVSTLDGSATGSDGLSDSINTPADNRVFGLLRALSDVVVVGAATVASEGYGPIQLRPELTALRAGRSIRTSGQPPPLAVVTRSGLVPDLVLTPRPGGGAVLVLCPATTDPGVVALLRERLGDDAVIQAGDGSVDLPAALGELADRGLSQVLCEGGPRLLSSIVEHRGLDELCLTWSPLLVGGAGPRIMSGPAVRQAWRLAHLLEDDGTLIGRWLAR